MRESERQVVTVKQGSYENIARLRAEGFTVIDDRPRRLLFDALLFWVGVFGVWPFADPGHSFGTLLSVVDVALHNAAFVALWFRWKLERRR